MTPREYEHAVAAHFQSQGFQVTVTPNSNDFGIDVFAAKGTEKLAIQAKMYGSSSRPVNREMVLQLHGAKDFFDCTRAILVTDGRMTDSATEVANKLNIEVLRLLPTELAASPVDVIPVSSTSQFDRIWERHVMPLAGQIISKPDGELTNTILTVDWAGVERLTSNGKKNRLQIEIFRMAVNHIFKHGSITRQAINDEYAKRGSSGVVLILSQIPEFEFVENPQGIRLRSSSGRLA